MTRTILLLFAVSSLTAIPQTLAEETAKVRFILTVDPALGGIHEGVNGSEEATNAFVPGENAFVSLDVWELRREKYKELRDWYTSIRKPIEPQEHTLQIKDGGFLPKALAIRAGDSIVPARELVGRMYFKGKEPPFGTAPYGEKFTFTNPESLLIQLATKPDTQRGPDDPEAYLFVVDHTCVSISSAKGIAELSGLPTGVEIPLQIFYPWGDLAPKYESPTLKFEGKQFNLACNQKEEVHHIQITPRTNKAK